MLEDFESERASDRRVRYLICPHERALPPSTTQTAQRGHRRASLAHRRYHAAAVAPAADAADAAAAAAQKVAILARSFERSHAVKSVAAAEPIGARVLACSGDGGVRGDKKRGGRFGEISARRQLQLADASLRDGSSDGGGGGNVGDASTVRRRRLRCCFRDREATQDYASERARARTLKRE